MITGGTKIVHNSVDAHGTSFIISNMTFAIRFQKTRLKRGLSLTEAAKLVGCTERLIRYWESGERTPKPATIDGALARLNKSKP